MTHVWQHLSCAYNIINLYKHNGPYAKKGAPSIKELLPKNSEELPKGTT